MKIQTILICLLSSLLLQPSAFPQGPLPPPGPPGPTMKSLDQIDSHLSKVEARTEKRTPLSGVPTTITVPGSYYLAFAPFPVATKGITIDADNVSIDLNGFTLLGAPGSQSGITVSGFRRHIRVYNGGVRGFGGNGVDLGNVVLGEIHSIQSSNNGGIGINAGDTVTVRDCVARENGADNFRAGSHAIITNCAAILSAHGHGFNVGTDCHLSGCVSNSNALTGFSAATHSSLVNCVAATANTRGFNVLDGCSITQCVARDNKDYGIYTEKGATVFGCTVSAQSVGIRVGDNSTISGCNAAGNTLDGLQATSNCLVINNNASSNLSNDRIVNGIHLFGTRNRVDSNMVTNNGAGIVSNGGTGADFVIRNVAAHNGIFLGINYSPNAGDTLGPTDKPPSTATSPWANFQ